MRCFVLVLAAACAACSGDTAPEDQIAEEQAIEAVKEVNEMAPPMEELKPEAILYPDMERYDMFGAACSYAPGTSMGARVVARESDAFIKLDGDVLRFAADSGSRNMPMGTRSVYDGREYSLRLEVTEEEQGTAGADPETSYYDGKVEIRDAWDRLVYSGTGTVQCGT
jgi:hypothetical protein